MTTELADLVIDGFDESFGIDIALYLVGSETVVERLIQEARAGFSGADVVETNGGELFILGQQGVLVPFESPAAETLVEGASYGDWTATRFNNFVISWNTELVPESERPTTWEDLADPKWEGLLSMEIGDVDWYKTLWEYWVNEAGKTPEEADALFEGMARNGLMVKGHTVTGQLLAAGEFAVAASNYSYLVQALVNDGAPVAWQPVIEPVISRPNGVGLVEGAQSPATAALFYEWLLTDGQQILADFGLDPSSADLATTGEAQLVFVDLEDLNANLDEWTDRYEELVELGRSVDN